MTEHTARAGRPRIDRNRDEPQGAVIRIPDISLVVLVGVSGCGKSTFARKHFLPTEVLSSDFFRGMVRDDEMDQTGTADAFEVLHFVARKRLRAGRLTAVDATNVQPAARKPLVALARECHAIPVAIVLNLPERVCSAFAGAASAPSAPSSSASSLSASRAWSASSAMTTCAACTNASSASAPSRASPWTRGCDPCGFAGARAAGGGCDYDSSGEFLNKRGRHDPIHSDP